MKRFPSTLGALAAAALLGAFVWACAPAATPQSAPAGASAPAPAVSAAPAPQTTPTPQAAADVQPTPNVGQHQRLNPNVIEEDELHFVERFPKKEYIRVDERHIRSPIVPLPVEFYKEDADYYYVYTQKVIPEQVAAADLARRGVTVTPTRGLPWRRSPTSRISRPCREPRASGSRSCPTRGCRRRASGAPVS